MKAGKKKPVKQNEVKANNKEKNSSGNEKSIKKRQNKVIKKVKKRNLKWK